MSNPIHCPACGNLMIEDKSPFYGGFMRVCFNCGKSWEISCRDDRRIKVEPFDSEGDPVIEGIVRWNYEEGRRQRGLV